LKDFGKLYGHFVYFTAIWYTYLAVIWYILRSFWYIFPVLGCCTKKNLATPVRNRYLFLKLAQWTLNNEVAHLNRFCSTYTNLSYSESQRLRCSMKSKNIFCCCAFTSEFNP
jgi:hypothetical protein